MEAIISIEVRMPIAKTFVWEAGEDNSDLERHLNWVDGEWEVATIQKTSYHQRVIA